MSCNLAGQSVESPNSMRNCTNEDRPLSYVLSVLGAIELFNKRSTIGLK